MLARATAATDLAAAAVGGRRKRAFLTRVLGVDAARGDSGGGASGNADAACGGDGGTTGNSSDGDAGHGGGGGGNAGVDPGTKTKVPIFRKGDDSEHGGGGGNAGVDSNGCVAHDGTDLLGTTLSCNQ